MDNHDLSSNANGSKIWMVHANKELEIRNHKKREFVSFMTRL